MTATRAAAMQTKLESFYETLINIAIGWTINFIANMLVLPLFGFDITLGQNVVIGCIYTAIALVRQYLIRRYFNGKITHAAIAIAARTGQAGSGPGEATR